jgi:hypothetical protein
MGEISEPASASAWGEPPRADHRLRSAAARAAPSIAPAAAGPNGIRQRRCHRSVPLSAMTSIARTRSPERRDTARNRTARGPGRGRARRRARASRCGDDLVVRALVRRVLRERRGKELGQGDERFGGSGASQTAPREPPCPLEANVERPDRRAVRRPSAAHGRRQVGARQERIEQVTCAGTPTAPSDRGAGAAPRAPAAAGFARSRRSSRHGGLVYGRPHGGDARDFVRRPPARRPSATSARSTTSR